MGVYRIYMWDLPVGRCWAEDQEAANAQAVEMFGVGGWAEEDENIESAKKAS